MPYDIGYGDECFDLIFLLDVLEHVEDDAAALDEIYKRLNANGRLVLTVPAYQFLFGQHDRNLFHFRRYNSSSLSQLIIKNKYKIEFCSYFNFWLFPLVLISRLIERLIKKSSGHAISGQQDSWINNIFYKIMSSEKSWLAKKKTYHFGSSIIMIASKG